MSWVRHVTVFLILGLSVYIGFGNTDDITNTVTVWQRLVGVAATAYGMLAVASIVGYLRRSPWLRPVLWIWASLVVITSVLAALVYGATGGSSLVVVAASAVLPGLALWAASGRAGKSRLAIDRQDD